MTKSIIAVCVFLGIGWSAAACAGPGGDWLLVSDADRESLLYLPASFKRDGEMVSVSVRIDNRPRVSYQGKEAAQIIVDAQGRPYAGTEHDWIIDCRDRSFVTKRSTQVGTDGQRIETISKGMPKNVRVDGPPKASDAGIFIDAACRNALIGINAGPPQNGFVLFRTNRDYILMFDPLGVRRQGNRAEAIVRLIYRRETAAPDGQRVALSDAIWALDCKSMQGAVGAEKQLAPDGKIVGELPKRTLAELKYTSPVPGGLPEAFQREVCDGRIAPR